MNLQTFPRRMRIGTRIAAVVGMTLCLGMLTACAATLAPTRVLPSHIQRVYIPEFRNDSRSYGLQGDLTLYVNDEFLSDGRLDVVQSERADVRLEGRIKTYKEYSSASGGERFPLVTTAEMVCVVELWDPYDTDRVVPLARYTVPAAISFVSDARRSIEEMDVDARERLLRQMAKNILQTVMNSSPEAPTKMEEKAVQRWRERHDPRKREPVMQQPRFPRPAATPAAPAAPAR